MQDKAVGYQKLARAVFDSVLYGYLSAPWRSGRPSFQRAVFALMSGETRRIA